MIAYVCFVVQPLIGPLQLALHEHSALAIGKASAHAHESPHSLAHAHGPNALHVHAEEHAPTSREDANEGPQFHSAASHVAPLAVQAALSKVSTKVFAAYAAWTPTLTFDLPAGDRMQVEVRDPRPPPARRAASPRAPPIVV